MTENERLIIKEKLRLYLKNLGGAYSRLVPGTMIGGEREKIRKTKEDFKKWMNQFYKQHDLDVELYEEINDVN